MNIAEISKIRTVVYKNGTFHIDAVFPRRAVIIIEQTLGALRKQQLAYINASQQGTNGQLVYRTEKGFNDFHADATHVQFPDYTDEIAKLEAIVELIHTLAITVADS